MSGGTVAVRKRGPLSFVLGLLAGYVLLYFAYMAIPDSLLQRVIFPWVTAKPAAYLINFLDPMLDVRELDSVLISGAAKLEVVRGCDGSGAIMLIAAATLALRASLRWKLIGAAGALLVLTLANDLRIAALYLVLARHPSWFLLLHVYVSPMLLVLLSSLWFIVWAGRAGALPEANLDVRATTT